MPLYRVLKNLSFGERRIERGELVPGSRFAPKALTALLMRRALSEVASPPLAILPGWKARAARLTKAQVTTVVELVEADAGALAETLRLKAETITVWQKEVGTWLTIAPLPRG